MVPIAGYIAVYSGRFSIIGAVVGTAVYSILLLPPPIMYLYVFRVVYCNIIMALIVQPMIPRGCLEYL